MQSVLKTCQPRPEILAGMFNPEVFTVSLSPVTEYYRRGRGVIDSIYTGAELFPGLWSSIICGKFPPV